MLSQEILQKNSSKKIHQKNSSKKFVKNFVRYQSNKKTKESKTNAKVTEVAFLRNL